MYGSISSMRMPLKYALARRSAGRYAICVPCFISHTWPSYISATSSKSGALGFSSVWMPKIFSAAPSARAISRLRITSTGFREENERRFPFMVSCNSHTPFSFCRMPSVSFLRANFNSRSFFFRRGAVAPPRYDLPSLPRRWYNPIVGTDYPPRVSCSI